MRRKFMRLTTPAALPVITCKRCTGTSSGKYSYHCQLKWTRQKPRYNKQGSPPGSSKKSRLQGRSTTGPQTRHGIKQCSKLTRKGMMKNQEHPGSAYFVRVKIAFIVQNNKGNFFASPECCCQAIEPVDSIIFAAYQLFHGNNAAIHNHQSYSFICFRPWPQYLFLSACNAVSLYSRTV